MSDTDKKGWVDHDKDAHRKLQLCKNIRLTTTEIGNNIVITMQAMHVTIRPIGNSKGVVLPKPILAQVGLENATDAEMTVENGVIVLRKLAKPARNGWAEAAKKLSTACGDDLVMGEFGNAEDQDLVW